MLTTKEIKAATTDQLEREIKWNDAQIKDLEQSRPKCGTMLAHLARNLEARTIYGQYLTAERVRRLLE